MICCDICWVVLGNSLQADDLIDKTLHFVGKWEICSDCLKRTEEDILKDIKSKKYKKN